MDTKLKKSSKLAKIIILLTVLLPAVFIVSLYPRMEKLMLEKREEYRNEVVANSTEEVTGATGQVSYWDDTVGFLSIQPNVVNYTVEASYYLYGRMLQDELERPVAFQVLDAYGWINDYYTLNKQTFYFAKYDGADGKEFATNAEEFLPQLEQERLFDSVYLSEKMPELSAEQSIIGAFLLEYDEYGMISNIEFVGAGDVKYDYNLYSKARNSVMQYEDNSKIYGVTHPDSVDVDFSEVIPKNFKAVYLIPGDCEFVNHFGVNLEYYVGYFNNPENLYVEIGAPVIILIALIIVAVVALLLPFVKRLETGWEKLFCMPIEIIAVLLVGFVGMAYFMFEAMCYTSVTELADSVGTVEILGYIYTPEDIYIWAMVGNVLGWTVLFFLEYTIVAHCRQFLCGPGYYLKHRILLVRICRWIGRQLKRLYHYVVDVDITKGLHSVVLKMVLINLVIIGLLCCLGKAGIIGALVYTLVLYVVFRRQGYLVQNRYNSILHATEQMAEGELKITMQEDLGFFAPLGEELEKVQEGFAKAVAEEAKSQKMKTELISNVSHDLKTPLTAIITYVNLLKREGVTEEERRNYVNTLDMKSQRLKVLIEDLFEVSKAQSGNIQMNYMDVDVVNLMKQLRLEMEDKIADSNLSFRWNLPEEKVILRLDGQKTYRVFENLLTNALKYALAGSRVFIDVENKEDVVEIIYKNTSARELETDAERLTERFVRGEASRTSEGSGLGLAIVKNFVELQGGSFRIEVDGDLFKAIIVWQKDNECC